MSRSVPRGLRSPLFPAIVLSLALGIAGMTVAHSAGESLLHPWGKIESERFASIKVLNIARGYWTSPTREVIDRFRRDSKTLESLVSFQVRERFVRLEAGSLKVPMARVGSGGLEILGIETVAGRIFTSEEASALQGSSAVVLLATSSAESLFGGADLAIGQLHVVDGKSRRVIGGYPPAASRIFNPGVGVQAILPGLGEKKRVQALGTLAPGHSLAALNSELEAWSGRQSAELTHQGRVRWVARSAEDLVTTKARRVVRVSWVAGLALLLVTASTVAQLLAATAIEERKASAVRWALGADGLALFWWRTRRLAALILAAAPVSALLTHFGLMLLTASAPEHLALGQASLEPAVLAVALGAIFALLCLVAAAQLVRVPVRLFSGSLREDSRLARSSDAAGGWSRAHVMVMAASACLLITVSLLILQAYAELENSDLGFRREGLVAAEIEMPAWKFASPQARGSLVDAARERLAQNPDFGSAISWTSHTPTREGFFLGEIAASGSLGAPRSVPDSVSFAYVDDRHFRNIGQPILAGRSFTLEEVQRSLPVAVISASMARLWAEPERALGESLTMIEQEFEIVGVVADLESLDAGNGSIETTVYWPLSLASASLPSSKVTAMARLPEGGAVALQQALTALDPDLIVRIESMDQVVAQSIESVRFISRCFLSISLLAIALAMAGVYGVYSRFAAQQRGQIAVRMALGASRGGVMGWLWRRGFLNALAGIALGFAASYPAALAIREHLVELGSGGLPLRLLAVALMLATVSLALWIPALRASRVQPTELLRGG
ncbi:MAG: ABC transporter permease [Acidobacteriota bacterium]